MYIVPQLNHHGATAASAVESLLWKGAGKKPTNKKDPPERD